VYPPCPLSSVSSFPLLTKLSFSPSRTVFQCRSEGRIPLVYRFLNRRPTGTPDCTTHGPGLALAPQQLHRVTPQVPRTRPGLVTPRGGCGVHSLQLFGPPRPSLSFSAFFCFYRCDFVPPRCFGRPTGPEIGACLAELLVCGFPLPFCPVVSSFPPPVPDFWFPALLCWRRFLRGTPRFYFLLRPAVPPFLAAVSLKQRASIVPPLYSAVRRSALPPHVHWPGSWVEHSPPSTTLFFSNPDSPWCRSWFFDSDDFCFPLPSPFLPFRLLPHLLRSPELTLQPFRLSEEADRVGLGLSTYIPLLNRCDLMET